jgi:hypothetical protein
MSLDLGPVPVFHPRIKVQKFEVGDERMPVVIFDDVLANAEEVVEWASTRTQFAPPEDTNYPGIVAPITKALAVGTLDKVCRLLSDVYGIPPEMQLRYTGHYGLITTPEEQLNAMQTVPHFDSPTPLRLALLLYLFQGAQQGTAFFRHNATGFETIDKTRYDAFMPKYEAELNARDRAKGGYFSGSDEHFTQIGYVESVFNRLVVYPSFLLHSACVDASRLTAHPESGRFTVNMFLHSSAPDAALNPATLR